MQVNVYQEGTKMNTEVNERPYHWFQQVPISYPKITNVMSDVSFNSMKAVWICWSRFILDISLVVYIFKVAVILYNIWYFCPQMFTVLCSIQSSVNKQVQVFPFAHIFNNIICKLKHLRRVRQSILESASGHVTYVLLLLLYKEVD